jgi:hypothetical protein
MSARSSVSHPDKNNTCIDVGKLQRLNYFYGQLLGVQDFQAEQDYFRDKLKLHNRCLHGYGVVCGLLVEPVPIPKSCTAQEAAEEQKLLDELQSLLQQKAAASTEATAAGTPAASATASASAPTPPAATSATPPAPEAPQTDPAPAPSAPSLDSQIEELRRKLADFYRQWCREEPHTQIKIHCGLAIDCDGNELVVRQPVLLDLLAQMSSDDCRRVKQGAGTVYISLCYCEQPVDPVRPVLPDVCGVAPGATYGRLQDAFRVQVTVDPPAVDTRCETCCHPCTDCCLLLARIDRFCPGHPLREEQIHNDVRRPLFVNSYVPTTITGINWLQGHHYTQAEARTLMGTRDRIGGHDPDRHRTKGLEIRFSRPVLTSTLHPGVMDTWVISGGRGRRSEIYSKSGELLFGESADKPKERTVTCIFFRDTTDEILEPGDRVLVILRTDFILDECCRPVAGANVGGRVPVIPEHCERYRLHPHHPEECPIPPMGCRPWTSGNGLPGGTFEGWFFVRHVEEEHARPWEENR